MKDTIKQIIESNLPEPAKGIEKVIENTEQDRIYNLLNENMVIGFNQALSQIDTSLIADEVLKVVELEKEKWTIELNNAFQEDHKKWITRWNEDIIDKIQERITVSNLIIEASEGNDNFLKDDGFTNNERANQEIAIKIALEELLSNLSPNKENKNNG